MPDRKLDRALQAHERLQDAATIDITTSPVVDQRVALGIEAVAFALLAINDTINDKTEAP